MGSNGGSKKELRCVADAVAAELERWKRIRLEARIWRCGDGDYCDCRLPVVERITPANKWPLIKRERLWSGSLHSQPNSEEWRKQLKELQAAAVAHDITLLPEEDWQYGWRYDD